MSRIRQSAFARSYLLPLALLLWVTACSGAKWVELKPPIERSLAEQRPHTVRLTLADDSVYILTTPVVEDDAVIGSDEGRMVPTGVVRDGVAIREHPRVSVPLADIRRAEMEKGASAAVPLLVSAAVLFGVLAFVASCKDSFVC